MIRRIFKMVNGKWNGMHEAAILLGVFSLMSQFLGLIRDRLLAHTIGPSATLDIYYASFQVPDLIYLSVASLASITVLMPFLVERKRSGGQEAAKTFFNEVLSGFLLLLIGVAVLIFFLMPYLAPYIVPGFTHENMEKMITVSRIMLLSPILMGLSNLLGTVTQLTRKFFIFSLSPILYNLALILGIVVLYPRFGVYGLGMGVVLGACIHVLMQVPTLFAAGFSLRISLKPKLATLKKVIMLSLPRTLGLSMNSIAILVIIALASTVGEGAISIFKFSINLETVPMGVIGISYAVASFPILTEAFAKGDMKHWQESIFDTVRQIIFWSLPLAALLIVFRAHVVRILLGTGVFSWNDTRLTAAALAIFSLALIGQNFILVCVRAFYSAHDTKKPLIINTLSSAAIVGGAFLFLHIFKTHPVFQYFMENILRVEGIHGSAVLMLPLAYALGTLVNALLCWIALRRQYLTSSGNLKRTLFESVAAAVCIGCVSYFLLNISAPFFNQETFWGLLKQALVAGSGGIIAGIILLYLLKSEAFFAMVIAFRQKFWKADISNPETTP